MYDIVRFGKSVQDPVRIRVLACLRGQELCKCELFATLNDVHASRLNVHLEVLLNAGLIELGRLGRWTTYRLATAHEAFIEAMFVSFDSDVSWDKDVSNDLMRLKARLDARRDGWCA